MIELYWMPGTKKKKKVLQEINEEFLRTISQKENIMYSTKTATTNNNEFNSSYMPVGINENVTLKEVNVKKTDQGRDFLEIVFENAQGQTATLTEWKNEKNQWIVTDEDLQRRDNQQFGRILQIIDAVNGQHADFEGNSFVEMINWVKTQLNPSNVGNQVRLKVVYDKKGYTKVSSLGVFVEPMNVPEEQSQIKLWKNDLLERPVQADVEKPVDPLSMNTAPVTETPTGADDLPF